MYTKSLMVSLYLYASGQLERPSLCLHRGCSGSMEVCSTSPRLHTFICLNLCIGSFIAGKHVLPNSWVSEAFGSRGYHIISIAYRFIPQCGIDDSISDCIDAFKWCLLHLPTILGSSTIDIPRYVVAGDSAGGTFSTLCGHLFDPKPKAVID